MAIDALNFLHIMTQVERVAVGARMNMCTALELEATGNNVTQLALAGKIDQQEAILAEAAKFRDAADKQAAEILRYAASFKRQLDAGTTPHMPPDQDTGPGRLNGLAGGTDPLSD